MSLTTFYNLYTCLVAHATTIQIENGEKDLMFLSLFFFSNKGFFLCILGVSLLKVIALAFSLCGE